MSVETLMNILLMAPPLIVAVVLHEVAHGYVAEKLGDPTARDRGRITLNPLKHIDLFMTILLPLMLILSKVGIVFGGAKAVPVNPLYFKNPRKGMLWVALAGPVTNFILAAISFGLLYFFDWAIKVEMYAAVLVHQLVLGWCAYSVLINIVLGLFNLLPVPPLDGGRIMVGILPEGLAMQYARLERFGFAIVIVMIYFGVPQLVLEPVISWISEYL